MDFRKSILCVHLNRVIKFINISVKKRINTQLDQTAQYRIQVGQKVKEEANTLFKNGEYEK
jgi:hypothetical protein